MLCRTPRFASAACAKWKSPPMGKPNSERTIGAGSPTHKHPCTISASVSPKWKSTCPAVGLVDIDLGPFGLALAQLAHDTVVSFGKREPERFTCNVPLCAYNDGVGSDEVSSDLRHDFKVAGRLDKGQSS